MKIVRKFINTKIGEQFKNTAFALWAKKSFIYQIFLRACGDWRYPFYVIGWKIANFLTMRKMFLLVVLVLVFPTLIGSPIFDGS